MSINISAFAGAGAQFSDANGAPLSGGLIYTYAAGTTTNAVTFTSRTGLTNNTNPIVLDSAGRTPAEIWLTGGSLYKFVLKDSALVQIGSYDNIPAINDVTTVSNLITVAGTNTLTGLGSPAVVAYTTGAQYTFVAQNNNTGAVTINIDTVGAKSITKVGALALAANDIIAGASYQIIYDGTRFQLLSRTSASQLVVGTTAERPASPTTGMIRMNSTTNNPEWYNATALAWSNFSQPVGYVANYLAVAGGSGGGYGAGGGGGAGGVLSGSLTLNSGDLYTIIIGSGGAGGTSTGSNGLASIISLSTSTITSLGGGGGGVTSVIGAAGGSGGGGGGSGTNAGGAGTAGQGNAGGSGSGTGVGPTYNAGGGGGGAAAVGGTSASGTAGTGGAGVSSSITGAAVTYAGGGGGGAQNSGVAGAGGAGGGGAGTASGGTVGVSGTANTGGGGGGGSQTGNGGNGGSGVVILSIPTANYTGTITGAPTVTTSGANTILKYTSSGTYTA